MIVDRVKTFLEKNLTKGAKLLVGYSGGADSKALLYALLPLREEYGFELELAHLDHGWREESKQEAFDIVMEAKKLSIPCHVTRCLQPEEGNLENYYRQERRKFFMKISEKLNAQAVVVAHHRDDQIETILKRLLEGASLSNLAGMQELSKIDDLPIWRPLLKVGKKEILDFLKEQALSFFEDRTNEDKKYLRARMRKRLIPSLERDFGKKITDNMICLASRSSALHDYLDIQTEKFFSKVQKSSMGLYLDLSECENVYRIEIDHLMERVFSLESLKNPSRDIKEMIFQALKENKSLQLPLFSNRLVIDRKRCFLLSDDERWKGIIDLDQEGEFSHLGWKIHVKEVYSTEKLPSKGWKALWKEKSSILLPRGSYGLALPREGLYYKGKRLKKRWQEERVPAFLRDEVPLVFDKEEVVGDFLLSHQPLIEGGSHPLWEITISK